MADQFPSDKARQHIREYFQERKTMADRKDMEPCVGCDGAGVWSRGDCPRCNGTGWEPERITERVPPPRTPDPVELVKAELERYREQRIAQRSAAEGVEWAVTCIRRYCVRKPEEQCHIDIHADADELWDWVELLVDKAQKLVDTINNQTEG